MRVKTQSLHTFNYIEKLLFLVSTVTAWVSISTFALLVGITISIVIAAVGLKICLITAGAKNLSQYLRWKGKSLIK